MELSAVGEAAAPQVETSDGLTLEDIRRRLREHARWKITMAERAAVMILGGATHTEIRAQLGLSTAQYRRVRRSLREAMCPESPERIVGQISRAGARAGT